MQKDLVFFGRGSATSLNPNSAYFETDDCFVILDCPMRTTEKLLNKDFSKKQPYILITHTHSDHVGGIGMFILVLLKNNIKPTIVAPSQEVLEDIKIYLRIEGVLEDYYNIIRADELGKNFLVRAIKTAHAPELEGKCFGYQLNINDKNVIYTGDTATLEPFLPYLQAGSYLYTEVSTHGGIHLKLDDAKRTIESLLQKGVKVYLMHMNNETEIQKQANQIKGNIELAPLVNKNDI